MPNASERGLRQQARPLSQCRLSLQRMRLIDSWLRSSDLLINDRAFSECCESKRMTVLLKNEQESMIKEQSQ
jgi:hypothetical protein